MLHVPELIEPLDTVVDVDVLLDPGHPYPSGLTPGSALTAAAKAKAVKEYCMMNRMPRNLFVLLFRSVDVLRQSNLASG